MGWFGSSSDEDKSSSSSSSSSNFDDHSRFGSVGSDYVAPAPGSIGAGAASFEQEVMMEQQQAIVKAAMLRLTKLSFDKCVTKPSSSLSSSEQSCISAVVTKYLELSQLVTNGMGGQGQ
jgi:import inner membrane translocase subunit TIM13